MIKKLAFIGGYLSAITLVLALLFMSLSYQNDIQVKKRTEILQSDLLIGSIRETYNEEKNSFKQFNEETGAVNLTSLKQVQISQTLMIVAILIFGATYLPYRFYSGYQRSQLELT